MIEIVDKPRTYNASGKLMMFGEYLVLRGSNSLSFPLEFGQSLRVEPSNTLRCESHDLEGIWFEADFDQQLKVIATNLPEVAKTLATILKVIRSENSRLEMNCKLVLSANFNLNWGIGSSSTFISLLSQWSEVDPYTLLEHSFGGSGYDIACATADSPILFRSKNEIQTVQIHSEIQDHLVFVYSGKKKSSKQEVNRFREKEVGKQDINRMNRIVEGAVKASRIEDFEKQMRLSEDLLAPILERIPLKEYTFAEYPFEIKSLGAWGGDFFMATFRDLGDAKKYFKKKGFDTVFTYKELIKCTEI